MGKAKKIEPAGWFDALRDIHANVLSDIPEGYSRLSDITERLGLARGSASHVKDRLMEANVAYVWVRGANGRKVLYFKD
jgi:hypothetical protein